MHLLIEYFEFPSGTQSLCTTEEETYGHRVKKVGDDIVTSITSQRWMHRVWKEEEGKRSGKRIHILSTEQTNVHAQDGNFFDLLSKSNTGSDWNQEHMKEPWFIPLGLSSRAQMYLVTESLKNILTAGSKTSMDSVTLMFFPGGGKNIDRRITRQSQLHKHSLHVNRPLMNIKKDTLLLIFKCPWSDIRLLQWVRANKKCIWCLILYYILILWQF